MIQDLIIVGGGAAGFFTALNVAEQNPSLKIIILERGKEVLSKVRISGGGRCNVTHAEFIPTALSKNYPRGEKELIGPFHTFMTGHMMEWLEERKVALKIEADGRVFPRSDSSQSIIDCFTSETKRLGIKVLTNHAVKDFCKYGNTWNIHTSNGVFKSKKLMVATGSNPKIWSVLQNLQHTVAHAVPSLFTFNIKDDRIKGLPGIVTEAIVKVRDSKLISEGPLLITHWGISGPCILKLSAWGAIELNILNYNFEVIINWLPWNSKQETLEQLKILKDQHTKQLVSKYAQFELPKRLWQTLVLASGIKNTTKWADISKKAMMLLSEQLTEGIFKVGGKSTFKEEFVTAGGIDLKEVNFKTFESKKHKNLYVAGEILNIDAITGGFNFQNAWSGAFIAAQAICSKDS